MEKSLRWLRGPKYDPTEELTEICESSVRARREKLTLSDFKTKAAVKSVEIAFWLMVFQQFSGANAVVFNTTAIFQVLERLGGSMNSDNTRDGIFCFHFI